MEPLIIDDQESWQHNGEMKLYVEPMDATVIEVRSDGYVKLENEDWSLPTLQERRAILYAAQNEMAALQELLELLETSH